MGKKRKLQRWTTEELTLLKEFFAIKRNTTERNLISAKLNRTFSSIYNKHWSLKNPVSVKKSKARTRSNAKTKIINKEKNEKIVVTHVQTLPQPMTIRIGEVVIETFSSAVKINDVLIEV